MPRGKKEYPSIILMRDVRKMTSVELERHWRVDFDSLVTTAIADAEGLTNRNTAGVLRSQEWTLAWQDALYCAEGSLLSSTEWMAYGNDRRLRVTQIRLRRVRNRINEVHILLKSRARAASTSPHDQAGGTAGNITDKWLVEHHHDESESLRRTWTSQAGLSLRYPWYHEPPLERIELVERAAQLGLTDYPVTDAVTELLDTSDEAFRNRVATDAQEQNRRLPELRHPILMNDWCAALQDLLEQTGEQAGVKQGHQLAELDIGVLHTRTQDEARRVLDARRFYRSCRQRLVEWEFLARTRGSEAFQAFCRAEKPWKDIEKMVRNTIASRHPRHRQAVLNALVPFCYDQDPTRIDPGKLGRKARNELRVMVLESLADGSWDRLL